MCDGDMTWVREGEEETGKDRDEPADPSSPLLLFSCTEEIEMSGSRPEQLGEKEPAAEPRQGCFCRTAAFKDVFDRRFLVWLWHNSQSASQAEPPRE